MRILYGIQGTGHGHLSRAREILPLLGEYADIDILISGYNYKMKLHGFSIMRKRGISLEYDSNGCISLLDTVLNIRPVTFMQDIQSISTENYDLVISDYEPVTSWASLSSGTPCIGLSHQSSFLSDKSPRPKKRSFMGEKILKHFAPCTKPIGFHFKKYDRFIEPPVIRKKIMNLCPSEGDHITVYLPAFDHQTLISIFSQVKRIKWEIFSPFCEPDRDYSSGNITVRPIGNEPFLRSLETCSGVVTSAGFETCAEALYLGKKLVVIPIRNQYEQLCNAAALNNLKVSVIYEWGLDARKYFEEWINQAPAERLHDVADTSRITRKLIRYASKSSNKRKKTSSLWV